MARFWPLAPRSGRPGATFARSSGVSVRRADRLGRPVRAAVGARGQPDVPALGVGPDRERPAAGQRHPRIVDPPLRGRQPDRRSPVLALVAAPSHPERASGAGLVAGDLGLGDPAGDHAGAPGGDRGPLGLDVPGAHAARVAPLQADRVAPGALDEDPHARAVVRRAGALRRRAVAGPGRQHEGRGRGERLARRPAEGGRGRAWLAPGGARRGRCRAERDQQRRHDRGCSSVPARSGGDHRGHPRPRRAGSVDHPRARR